MKQLLLSVVVFVGLAVSGCSAPTSSSSITEPASIENDAGPTRFSITIEGAGPNIILIPGLASHPDIFASTVERLQDRYTLHSVHVSGFAGAPPAGNAGQSEILVPLGKEIANYAASLGGSTIVIGHSLGGLTALIAGLEEPDAFDRIMVIDVLPFFSVLMDPDATTSSITGAADFLKATLLSQTDQVFEAGQREGIEALTKSARATELSLAWSLTTDRGIMAEAMHDVLTTDLRERISLLDMPITILYGRDELIPNMARVEMQFQSGYAPAPNAQVIPIDGALHFIMQDQPEAYVRQLEGFLSQ